MMTPEERYVRDAHFHRLVDILTQQIIECNYTPTELREAAMLAAIHYEMRHARPSYLIQGDSLRRVDGYHGKEDLS